MRFPVFVAALVLSISSGALHAESGEAHPCGLENPCHVGDRVYRALPPSDWDRTSALPVLVHFHGWKRDSRHPLNNHKVLQAIDGNKVLLVAPEGLGRTWDFWDRDNRDVPFVREVLADVARHYPIDQSRIYAPDSPLGPPWPGVSPAMPATCSLASCLRPAPCGARPR